MMRYKVKAGGQHVGYIELVRLGELRMALAYGAPPIRHRCLALKDALEFVQFNDEASVKIGHWNQHHLDRAI